MLDHHMEKSHQSRGQTMGRKRRGSNSHLSGLEDVACSGKSHCWLQHPAHVHIPTEGGLQGCHWMGPQASHPVVIGRTKPASHCWVPLAKSSPVPHWEHWVLSRCPALPPSTVTAPAGLSPDHSAGHRQEKSEKSPARMKSFLLVFRPISKEDAAGRGKIRGEFSKLENNRDPNVSVSSPWESLVVEDSAMANEQTKARQSCGVTLSQHLQPRVLRGRFCSRTSDWRQTCPWRSPFRDASRQKRTQIQHGHSPRSSALPGREHPDGETEAQACLLKTSRQAGSESRLPRSPQLCPEPGSGIALQHPIQEILLPSLVPAPN
ncbi:PREDICTED: uncharacterized protein LOC108448065 [Corvus brachyrhynchos]|uniref:uncharacterized protein LOC108448065 n=1 Tax=Corvus brachyrhynchos TaxID=85066 RepID=UPI0008167DE6|nr:PREDICTED: uncharacterized protein LOC108448065 [Corvus brachyrhynchos]